MRDSLLDVVKMTKDLFTTLKVTGTDEATRIEAVTSDHHLFLKATLTSAQPALGGVFGLYDLATLDTLFTLASYRAEGSGLAVQRDSKATAEGSLGAVTGLRFTDAQGEGSTYRTMAGAIVEKQAVIKEIAWGVTAYPSKSKVAEFAVLAKAFGSVDKLFSVRLKQANLIFEIGDAASTNHHVSLLFERDVGGELAIRPGRALRFDTSHFLTLMRVAGVYPTTLTFSGEGVLGLKVDTDRASYQYYLKAHF